jgi:hypothetical protein
VLRVPVGAGAAELLERAERVIGELSGG